MCIFEIPIYCISPENLMKRYNQKKKSFESEYRYADRSRINIGIDLETYPYRLWQYNHIVGYIKISTNGWDMLFDVFLPVAQRERFRWRSNRKVFVYNILANGTHFYLGNMKSNAEIMQRLNEMLEDVIKTHVPKRLYVDKSAFVSTYRHIDYMSIIQEESKNGQA